MALAKRVKNLKCSPTLQLTSLAKKLTSDGIDVVSFGAGEPDFDTPDFVKKEAIEAIRSGFTKYTPSSGIPELKKAIQAKFKNENNLAYSLEQIVVSSGAKHCLFNIILAIVDRGDEVVIPSPYWVSYPEMVNAAEGIAKTVVTEAADNFKIKPKELEKVISDKTKLLILNSPSNPTGSVYSKEELEEIAEICCSKNIYIISDEIYEKLIYDNLTHTSIAGLNNAVYKLTFTVNGVSKAYSMTGWRIGYFAGPLNVVEAVKNIQDHSTSNPCSISQKAALAALSDSSDWLNVMRAEFKVRRDYLTERIRAIPSLSYIKPEGAFYLFCNISKTGLRSQEFSMRLLKEANVAVIPGDGFGCDDYVRFSFATSIETIKKGIDRLEKWLKQLPKKS